MQLTVDNLVEVRGIISHILYNKDNYMIGKINVSEDDYITFKGNIFGVEKKEEIIFKGNWIIHQKYGKQLEVQKWERPIPKTKEKIIAYLSSSHVKGCGEKQALKIFSKLGTNAIEIIMREKENAFVGIKGIGRNRAITISNSVIATYELQDIITELSEYGLDPSVSVKLYGKFKNKTVQVIKQNPYVLSDKKFLSFPKVDEIAKRIGFFPISAYRIEACIHYLLRKLCYSSGHCFIEEKRLVEMALRLLNENTGEKADENNIIQTIYDLEERTIIIEGEKVYPKELYIYETNLSKKIRYILSKNQRIISDLKLENAIKEYQLKHGMVLGEEQKEAIKTVMNNNITILTGSAGTGKTTVVKAILEIYRKFYPKHTISLSAPTGRASRKLEETTGHLAQTNHRLLGYKQNFRSDQQTFFEYNEDNKLKHHFFVIDEMSMVDLFMSYSLFRAMDNNSKVLLIGDVNQLPSLSAGNVLKDLIDTENIPTVHLKQIYRQARNSQIITNANNVNEGKDIVVDHSKGDMFFISQQDSLGIANMIIQSVSRFTELGYLLSDILVLSPMKKGPIGTIELNQRLQQILNPQSNKKAEINYRNRIFRVGDKIMQTVNRAEKGIYNGDIGIITYIGKQKILTDDGTEVEVDTIQSNFHGVTITHLKEEWNDLELGYSISIHKSQGGQAPIVIMPISTSHYIMLARNLIYTGMTRAEEKLVIIGQRSAMKIAINNNRVIRRNTNLTDRLCILLNKKIIKSINI